VSDPGFWDKLKRGLSRTHGEWLARVDAAVSGRGTFDFDDEIVEHLEEALIAADLGLETALELVENVRSRATRADAIDVVKLRQMLVDEMAILLLDAPRPPAPGDEPRVTLIVGVNGAGKTTSAAKLARWSEARGEKALLAAADTFRAAAVEQLALWGERLGVAVIRQPTGSDAAALVFDALQAARARKVRHLIVDTAGRLHNKEHLMAELGKIRRVIDREGEGFSRRSLLVLDATTGQNAIAQAREFSRVAAIDGVLLAKLDGTAKGGMAVAIARELELPILFLGVGEGADDLIEFRPRDFAAALLG
jgi:fused signal recognition particle receptor